MVLIREINSNENLIHYISTVGFFCAVSCTIIMLRFRGFKATFNLLTGKNNNIDSYEKSPGEPICGAYRGCQDFISPMAANSILALILGHPLYLLDKTTHDRVIPEPPRKIAPSPSMVQLSILKKNTKPTKSTNDLTNREPSAVPPNRTSTPNLAQKTKPTDADRNQVKERKKLEKQQQEDQIKRDKLEAQERKKQEKLKKEREKHRNEPKKPDRSKTKRSAPQPHQVTANSINFTQQQCSTNTLESSISKSSGPPPYSPPAQLVPHDKDNTGNISFVKPPQESSWDMISEHRQEINKQQAVEDGPKQTHIDLHYHPDTSSGGRRENSNA